MRQSIFAAILAFVLASCNYNSEGEVATKAIGYEIEDDGNKLPLYSGDMSNLAVWEEYIEAHNSRNLDVIKSLNAEENFEVYGPKGEFIQGSDAHLEFLKNWFTQANPKWKTKYLIENEFTNSNGELRQWVTSGHQLTLMVEGEEIKLSQVHDALISNGKVQMFYVTERVLAEGE